MYNNHKLFELVTVSFKVLFNFLFVEIAFSIFDLYYLDILKNNGSVGRELQIYWDIKANVFYYCSQLMPPICGLIFIVWFYREYWNLQYLFRQYTFRFKPLVAVFAFIIPVFNLFAPFEIMREILAGYRKYYNKSINEAYVYIWWIGYWVYAVYSKTISFQEMTSVDDFIRHTYHVIISNSIGIVSLTFLILILKKLTPNAVRNYF